MQLNKLLKGLVIVGIYSTLIVPLIVSRTMFFPFITGKNFTFRIIVELITAVWLILALRDARYRPKFSWILASLSAFMGVILLADIFGASPVRSFWSNFERMEGFMALIHLYAYFLVLSSVFTTDRLWRGFLYTAVGFSVFVGLYGILQITGELVINQGGLRLDATFGNAIYLSIYMLFHLFFTLFLFLRKELKSREILVSYLTGFLLFIVYYLAQTLSPQTNPGSLADKFAILSLVMLLFLGWAWNKRFVLHPIFQSFAYVIVAGLQLSILFLTATRGTTLGLFGGIVVSAILIGIFGHDRPRMRKASVGAIVALVLLSTGFWIIKDSDFVQNNNILSRFAALSLKEGKSRFLVWNMAWQGFKERPMLGWGQSNFEVVFNKYYDPKMYTEEPWFDRTHNIFTDWMVAAGAIGLLAYLSVYISTISHISRGAGNYNFTSTDRVLTFGLLAAYFFSLIFVFDNITSYLFFFILLAYLNSAYGHETKGAIWKKLSSDRGFVSMLAAPFIIIAAFFAVYTLNVKGIRAARTLIQAMIPPKEASKIEKNLEFFKKAIAYHAVGRAEAREQLLQLTLNLWGQEGISDEVKGKFVTATIEEMKTQVEDTEKNARYPFFLGSFLRRIGQTDDALKYLGLAQSLSPGKQYIAFEIGVIHLGRKEYDKALEIFKKAYESEPRFDEARNFYAVAAIYAQKQDLASQLLTEQYGTDAPFDERIIRAYHDNGRQDKVLEIWQGQVKAFPDNHNHRLSLAAAYLNVDKMEEAIVEIQKAMELNPDEKFKERAEFFISEIRAGRKP